MSYMVELLLRLNIYLIFHVSYLKPYHDDKDDPSLGILKKVTKTIEPHMIKS